MIKTAEGLYLTTNDEVKNWPKFEIESNYLDKYALADADLRSFQILKLQAKTRFETCLSVMSLMQLLYNENDKYLTITNYKGEKQVIYVSERSLYIPKCTPISWLKLDKENEQHCYADPKVLYGLNNSLGLLEEGVGYLTPMDGIVKLATSKLNAFETRCNHAKIITLDDKGRYLKLHAWNLEKKRKVEIVNHNNLYKVGLFEKEDELNFNRDHALLEGDDVMENMNKITEVNIQTTQFIAVE